MVFCVTHLPGDGVDEGEAPGGANDAEEHCEWVIGGVCPVDHGGDVVAVSVSHMSERLLSFGGCWMAKRLLRLIFAVFKGDDGEQRVCCRRSKAR